MTLADPARSRRRRASRGEGGAEIDHVELFGPPRPRRRRQPQLRALPRRRLRPLALRHRHLGEDGRAARPRRARAAGERWRQESDHRQPLHGLARGARRAARAPHPGPRLRHRTDDALLRSPRSVPRRASSAASHELMPAPDVARGRRGDRRRGLRRGARGRRAAASRSSRRASRAAGATAAAMGHVVVMDDSEAQFALTALLAPALDRAGAGAARASARTSRAARSGSPRTTRSCAHVPQEGGASTRQRGVARRDARRGGSCAAPSRSCVRPRRGPARAGRPRASTRQRRALACSSAPRAGRGRGREGVEAVATRAARVETADGHARGRRGRERRRRRGAASDAGPADRAAQGPPRDHRPLPRLLPPPARRARLPEERAHAVARVGGVQPAAARDRPDARSAPRASSSAWTPSINRRDSRAGCSGAPSSSARRSRVSPRCAHGSASVRRPPTICRSSAGGTRPRASSSPRATRASASRRRRPRRVSSPTRSSAAASPIDPGALCADAGRFRRRTIAHDADAGARWPRPSRTRAVPASDAPSPASRAASCARWASASSAA